MVLLRFGPVKAASASQGGASVGQIRSLTRPQPGKETRSGKAIAN